MKGSNAKSRFLGGAPPRNPTGAPAPMHGHKNSLPPEAYTPVKPEASERRGPTLGGIKSVKSFG